MNYFFHGRTQSSVLQTKKTIRDNENKIHEVGLEKNDVFALAKRPPLDKDTIVGKASEYIIKWTGGENGRREMETLVANNEIYSDRQIITLFCAAIALKNDIDPTQVTLPSDIGKLLQKISLKLTKENETVKATYTRTLTEEGYKEKKIHFNDRTVLVLHLKDQSGKNLVIANVHLPCRHREIVKMTSLAFKAKQYVINWMQDKNLLEYPLILCGDLNSDPNVNNGTAYHCIAGNIPYLSDQVNTDTIDQEEFSTYVTNEQWVDCLSIAYTDGFTNYGLTKDSFERDGAPTARHLDHIFLRDKSKTLNITTCECPLKEEIATITGGEPIPNLKYEQPSDHLPISVSFKFKE